MLHAVSSPTVPKKTYALLEGRARIGGTFDLFRYPGVPSYGGIPNLASTLGYTNASWTLKSELSCDYTCRVLNYMQAKGHKVCVPRNDDATVKNEPWLNLSSGYIQRVADKLPKQGSKRPWKLHQNYVKDVLSLKFGSLDDGVMRFLNATD